MIMRINPDREATGRPDATMRVEHVFTLPSVELRDDDGALAVEVRPERIEARAEKRSVRSRLTR